MRRATLIVVLLGLCGCDDPQQLQQALAACKVKAFEVYGPEPPPCFKVESAPDYATCKVAAANKQLQT